MQYDSPAERQPGSRTRSAITFTKQATTGQKTTPKQILQKQIPQTGNPLGSFEHSYPKKPKNHEYILSYNIKKVKQFSHSHHPAFAPMSQSRRHPIFFKIVILTYLRSNLKKCNCNLLIFIRCFRKTIVFCATLPIFFFTFCHSSRSVNKIYHSAFGAVFAPSQKAINLCKFCTKLSQNFLQSHKKYFWSFFDFFSQSVKQDRFYSVYFHNFLIFPFLPFLPFRFAATPSALTAPSNALTDTSPKRFSKANIFSSSQKRAFKEALARRHCDKSKQQARPSKSISLKDIGILFHIFIKYYFFALSSNMISLIFIGFLFLYCIFHYQKS